MRIEQIPVVQLRVNQANDRHAELENETAAIAELFRLRENHMRALAADIAQKGRLFEPPLVWPTENAFVVFDGNRRITCLKLIVDPSRAPTQELQTFFAALQSQWNGDLPSVVECEVEEDREIIDEMIFRRHTGSQGGVGRSDWDDRAKRNFIERTGRGGRLDLAVEVEKILAESGALPDRQIPRSNLNRLLSSEVNRNRIGISLVRNNFSLTHKKDSVIPVLSRIADDLSAGRVVLGDIWDNEGKRSYLNNLEAAGLLPSGDDLLDQPLATLQRSRRAPRGRPAQQRVMQTFIPHDAPQIPWNGSQSRVRAIWDELRTLSLHQHPNAVSALARMLLELLTSQYLERMNIQVVDRLSDNFRKAIESLLRREIIDQKYFDELNRLRQDELISIRSMQSHMHSMDFAPMLNELIAYSTRLQRYFIAVASD